MTSGTALAAFAPKVSVASNQDLTLINWSQASSDDAMQSLTLYVPTYWTANTAAPPGAPVGSAVAKGVLGDQGASAVSLIGDVEGAVATTAITYGGTPTTVGALATACTGAPTASGYWVLTLTGGGQTVQLPIYTNLISTDDGLSDFASYTTTICQPSPDLPAGAPGRSPAGLKLTDVTLTLDNGYTPFGSAWYLWRARATPFVAATGAPNSAGAVEVQSLDRHPYDLSLSAKAAGKKQASVSGRLTEGGAGIAKAAIQLLVGTKVVATLTSAKSGKFVGTVKLPSPAATLVARAAVPTRTASACQSALLAPLPCTSSTIGGFTVASDPAAVKT
jgi:hypothetical protein